ncbi:MAG: hypothetical protein ABIC40_04990, partial [bacterium]
MRFVTIWFVTAILAIAVFGCTADRDLTSPNPAPSSRLQDSTQFVLEALEFSWDGLSDNLTVVPDRLVEMHYNATPFLKGYVKLKMIDWDFATRILTLEATIENPLIVDVYDVRGILTNLGDKKLLNPDDYTKIFDKNIPPVANPFRAFAKDEAFRKFRGRFSLPEQHIKTEIYKIYFPGAIKASFIVTACYPGNAEEPYDIVDIHKTGELFIDSGSLEITAEVLDWQDVTADHVVIEPNPITVSEVNLDKIDDTHWRTTITNVGGVGEGDYELWLAAHDESDPNALYYKFTVHVGIPGQWSDPIIVAGEPGVDEILPRIILREDDYWIIYTDGTSVLAKSSSDQGLTWSDATTIAGYPDTDTIHAVLGGDNGIYVQYQRSDTKYTYHSDYHDGVWSSPVNTAGMGMTLPPVSCDLGIGSDGHVYSALGDMWSAFAFISVDPWSTSSWNYKPIAPLYQGTYSINDAFIQNADIPKLLYVHYAGQLEYAHYDSGWTTGIIETVTEDLIEPALAPESDGPYHGVMSRTDGDTFSVEYFRFDSWPPSSPYKITILSGITEVPFYHSISAEGDTVSILFDVDDYT